ncbi:MAG: Wzz/FepE/Etk N-terminal domain-containing protein, partial [Pseudomonadota bacterium]
MANRQNGHSNGTVDAPAPGYAPRNRPRLGLLEVLLHLWRSKWLMLLIFLPILACGVYLASRMPAKYTSEARLLVSLDENYLFRVSMAGASLDVEDIMRAEINMLHSPEVAERIVRRFGLTRLYPQLVETRGSEELINQGVAAVLDDLTVGALPGQRLIFAEFVHRDAELSTEVLNAIIGSYFSYRSEVFEARGTSPFVHERQSLEVRLLELDEQILAFRNQHGLSDFASERASLRGFEGNIQNASLASEARLSELNGRIEAFETELISIDPVLELPIEGSATDQLLQLTAEREELLTRYLDTSQTIAAVDRRLSQLQVAADEEVESGLATQSVPNPEYTDLAERLSALRRDADIERQNGNTLRSRMNQVSARNAELLDLEPAWQDLQRQRAGVEDALRGLVAREFDTQTYIDAVRQTADAVQVVRPAEVRDQDFRYRLPILLLFAMMAFTAALTAGLLRALTHQGFETLVV